jgi:hypothetical protein
MTTDSTVPTSLLYYPTFDLSPMLDPVVQQEMQRIAQKPGFPGPPVEIECHLWGAWLCLRERTRREVNRMRDACLPGATDTSGLYASQGGLRIVQNWWKQCSDEERAACVRYTGKLIDTLEHLVDQGLPDLGVLRQWRRDVFYMMHVITADEAKPLRERITMLDDQAVMLIAEHLPCLPRRTQASRAHCQATSCEAFSWWTIDADHLGIGDTENIWSRELHSDPEIAELLVERFFGKGAESLNPYYLQGVPMTHDLAHQGAMAELYDQPWPPAPETETP